MNIVSEIAKRIHNCIKKSKLLIITSPENCALEFFFGILKMHESYIYNTSPGKLKMRGKIEKKMFKAYC